MAFSKERAHERAERYAARGQHDKAAREYQSVVDHDPKDIRAWLMLADCLARAGDRPGAVSRYLQVAEFYAGANQHAKALAVYRQVLNLEPHRLDVHLKTATLNMEIGRTQDALASYEHLGQAQLQAGRVGEALKTYRIIADADPTAVSKRLRLAELYSRERMLTEAVDAFRAAGQVLLQTDRLADYVRVGERLLYHRPDDRPTMRELARVYLKLGDARRALMKLNALLQADQGDTVGLELLGETFMAMGKPDKATSVMVELVRHLAETAEDDREVRRVIDKGLGWSSDHPDLLRLKAELEAPATTSDPLELDPEDSDVVELDDADVLTDPDAMPMLEPDAVELEEDDEDEAGVPVAAPATMTDSVMREVVKDGVHLHDEPSEDFDKILFEARVYVKYRLFDHALDHVQQVLEKQPRHVGAQALRARTLSELGRRSDAARVHVEVARLVADRDPKLAREHLEAALECDASVGEARQLLARIDQGPRRGTGGAEALALPIEPDSDGIDLLDEADEDDELAIEVADLDDEDDVEDVEDYVDPLPAVASAAPVERDFPIEDRFGLGDLEGDDAEAGDGVPGDAQAGDADAALAAVLGEIPADLELEDDFDEFAMDPQAFADVDLDRGMRGPLPEPHEPPGVVNVDLDDHETDLELELEEPPAAAGSPSPASEPRSSMFAPPVAPPAPAPPPRTDWPDISDELAEVRFFMDQGLEEDAELALSELRQRFPGHPELAALGEAQAAAQAPPPSMHEEGSVPLLDLASEEDAEADAYLSAIFTEEPHQAPAKRQAEIKARRADVEQADAQTHFDLGMAYREMGLVDESLREFEAAARDVTWRSRALTMAAALRAHRGETEQAVADLQRAVETANTGDERSEATYELAMLYERLGNARAAIEHLRSVPEGYRDRDERLVALQG